VTARREVPFSGDTLAWVHTELADIKSRLSLVQSAAEQSRNLATDAAEKAHFLTARVDQVDAQSPAIAHLQEEIRLVRDQQGRALEDINSLRLSREEIERRLSVDSERERQELNDLGRRFGEFQRQIDAWHERIQGYEEINRKNLEAAAQLQIHMEAVEGQTREMEALHARLHSATNRIDQELTRVSSALPDLYREAMAQKERFQSIAERLSRLEGELEALRTQMGRVDRIDDRLELVQAERSRHGERITDLTLTVDRIQEGLGEYVEKAALVDVRIAGYQEDIRGVDARLTDAKEHFAAHLRGLAEIETEMRKREIAALEREMREIRSRGISLGED